MDPHEKFQKPATWGVKDLVVGVLLFLARISASAWVSVKTDY
jgi:hypothetical protein